VSRSNGVASGVLMLLAGAFLVLRTVRRPADGSNLVDLILGGGGSGATTTSTKADDLLALPKLTQKPQTAPSPVRRPKTNNAVPIEAP